VIRDDGQGFPVHYNEFRIVAVAKGRDGDIQDICEACIRLVVQTGVFPKKGRLINDEPLASEIEEEEEDS
jgi:hypothetical protein